MQSNRQRYAILTLTITLSLGLAVTWMAIISQQSTVSAAPSLESPLRYVSSEGNDSGNDCTDSNSPCLSLQHSVDEADLGDEIRVAFGTYTGTLVRANNYGYTFTQVVYIDKDLSLRGGYSPSNWEVPDPDSNPTVIDAEGYGRGITIIGTGTEVITVDGFTITNGDYTGLGNPDGIGYQNCYKTDYDCGGGVFIYRAGIHLFNSKVVNNNAGDLPSEGGGLYLWETITSHIENTLIQENSATEGGGMQVHSQYHPLSIQASIFQGNTAEWLGGGINLSSDIENRITISDTQFLTNTVEDGEGGGIHARLTDEGLIFIMDRVAFQGNQASHRGKAILVDSAGSLVPEARLTNLLLTQNGDLDPQSAQEDEAVIAIGPGFAKLDITLAHLTAADNPVPTFLHAECDYNSTDFITVTLYNNLLSGFDNAYAATENGSGRVTLHHTNTLLHNVTTQHLILDGSPTLEATDPLTGNPLLDPTYHLQAGSDAIDAGVDAGVLHDIDGDPRPMGNAPDIGADETAYLPYLVFIPMVLR
jgi:hypothetical protein